jgi:hypothetical protein
MMQHKFFRLFSYAKNKDISVAQFLTNNQLHGQFHLPLSVEAFQEHQQMQQIIQQIQISTQDKDSWHYIWVYNRYTSSKFYHFPYRNIQPPPRFIWIWYSKFSNKLKVFVWLLLMDRLNVHNILKRKNTTYKTTTTTTLFAQPVWRKPLFICSLYALSVPNVGTTVEFMGTLISPFI